MTTITLAEKLTPQTKSFIIQAIYEVLNDPDFGLELTKRAKQRLYRSLTLRRKTIPFTEIKKKHC